MSLACRSQIRTELSPVVIPVLAAASQHPSSLTARETSRCCLTRKASGGVLQSLAPRFHKRTVESALPLTSQRSSAVNTSWVMRSHCPLSTLGGSEAVAGLVAPTRTLPTWSPLARQLPS